MSKGSHWDVLEYYRKAAPWLGSIHDEASLLCSALDDLATVKARSLADCAAAWVTAVPLTEDEVSALSSALDEIEPGASVRLERNSATLRARVVKQHPGGMVVTEEISQ